MLDKLFGDKRVDQETLFALEWKKPESIHVLIKKSDTGYFAKVTNLDGNVVTQADNAVQLVEMVNEAVYDFLDIPVQYREKLGYFMPPKDVRDELSMGIPDAYLNKEMSLQKA